MEKTRSQRTLIGRNKNPFYWLIGERTKLQRRTQLQRYNLQTRSKLICGITFLKHSQQTLRNARKMVYFCEEIGNLCLTYWFKQGSIMFFFRNKLNMGKKLNVNLARISKTPPSHFSRNLKFKIKTRRRTSLITRKQKCWGQIKWFTRNLETPHEWKEELSSFVHRDPQRLQRCFRIWDTPKSCKDISSEICRILHILRKPNAIIALLFMQNNSNFKNELKHAYLCRC